MTIGRNDKVYSKLSCVCIFPDNTGILIINRNGNIKFSNDSSYMIKLIGEGIETILTNVIFVNDNNEPITLGQVFLMSSITHHFVYEDRIDIYKVAK